MKQSDLGGGEGGGPWNNVMTMEKSFVFKPHVLRCQRQQTPLATAIAAATVTHTVGFTPGLMLNCFLMIKFLNFIFN